MQYHVLWWQLPSTSKQLQHQLTNLLSCTTFSMCYSKTLLVFKYAVNWATPLRSDSSMFTTHDLNKRLKIKIYMHLCILTCFCISYFYFDLFLLLCWKLNIIGQHSIFSSPPPIKLDWIIMYVSWCQLCINAMH